MVSSHYFIVVVQLQIKFEYFVYEVSMKYSLKKLFNTQVKSCTLIRRINWFNWNKISFICLTENLLFHHLSGDSTAAKHRNTRHCYSAFVLAPPAGGMKCIPTSCFSNCWSVRSVALVWTFFCRTDLVFPQVQQKNFTDPNYVQRDTERSKVKDPLLHIVIEDQSLSALFWNSPPQHGRWIWQSRSERNFQLRERPDSGDAICIIYASYMM